MGWIDDTMAAVAAASGSAATQSGDKPVEYVYYGDRGRSTQIPIVETRTRRNVRGNATIPEFDGGRVTYQERVGSRPGVEMQEDIRIADEVRGQVLAWHGTPAFDRWGSTLLKLGLIDAGDEASVEILDAVWQDAVDLSARFLAAGKKVTPWKAAELMASGTGTGNGGRYGSSGGAFTGNRSSTSRSVDLTDPATAKAITNDALSQALGRAARPEEAAQFLQVINSAERASPTVTTSNTRYEADKPVSESSTTSGGLTSAGRSQMVTDRAQALPEYGAFQAASTYYNALVSALDSPV